MKLLRWALIVAAAAGLVIDAWAHLAVAHVYEPIRTSTVNEAVLFRIEAALALVSAAWLVLHRHVLSIVFAALVSGGGAFVLLLYNYVDVGKIGPVPDMYDPFWRTEKKWSLAGELIALAGALVLLGMWVYERRGAARGGAAWRNRAATLPG
jgi:hypothetical protein